MRAVLPFLVILALSAAVLAKGDAAPKPDVACKETAECGFTHIEHDCCWACGVRFGTKAWVRALEAFCKAHPPAKSCPVPSCGQADTSVACVQGRCVHHAGP